MPRKLPLHLYDHALDADINTMTIAYDTMLLHYLQNANDSVAVMECLQVTRLKHVKQKSNLSQHEYLAIEVVIKSHGKSIYFQIECLQDQRPRTVQEIAHDDKESADFLWNAMLNCDNLLEELNSFLSKSLHAASATTSANPIPVI